MPQDSKTDALSLDELVAKAQRALDAMTDEQRKAMYARQAASTAQAEASWPKPNYRMENGVKVYESYQDYLAD